jgi:hypothetical protein
VARLNTLINGKLLPDFGLFQDGRETQTWRRRLAPDMIFFRAAKTGH